MSVGWFDIAVQRSVYTRMVSSKARARACFGFGVVVIRKVGSEGSAPGRRHVFRTMPPSSSNSVRKLCAGVPSPSVCVATLRNAFPDLFASATGSRFALAF